MTEAKASVPTVRAVYGIGASAPKNLSATMSFYSDLVIQFKNRFFKKINHQVNLIDETFLKLSNKSPKPSCKSILGVQPLN